MSSIVVSGDTSGAVTLSAPAVAGTVTVTLPSTSGVMAVGGGTITTLTTTSDITVQGVTVGRGAGAVSTNTAVGASALAGNSTGAYTTAIGNLALNANTASHNVGVGYGAMLLNTTGITNTAVGTGVYGTSASAMQSNTSGSYNSAYGNGALASNTTASNNTAVGYQAGYINTTGATNCFFGNQAGYTANSSSNTFIGPYAGYYVSSGAKNTVLGGYNGNQGGLDIRTASNYIVLSDGDGNPNLVSTGTGSISSNHPSVSGNSEFCLMRGSVKRWFIWNDNSTNNFNIVPSSFASGVTLTPTATAWSVYSDKRIKSNIVDLEYGLDTIMAMQPRRYTVTANGVNSIGFIAQELKTVLPEAVVGEEIPFDDADTPQERSSKTMGIAKDHIIPVLVKAIQELKAEVDSLKAQLNGASA
jgi:hypothetical protein